MKIGIIREGKTPPDSRVPLTPKQCKAIQEKYPVQILVQPSPNRCYKNEEYQAEGIQLSDDMQSCDVLMGVKEVPIYNLIPSKTYFFFSHTIKKQSYNRKLLQAMISKDIRMIDYEVLTNDRGQRLIAFGKFAGMVGAHNGLMTYGMRTGEFSLPRMNSLKDYAEAKSVYKQTQFTPIKIALTGTGRVGSGAKLVLDDMGIREVESDVFLTNQYDEAVYTVLDCTEYVKPKDGRVSFEKIEFYKNPADFENNFLQYAKVADLMINGIYWDNAAPAFFTVKDMCQPDFNIKVIADVTCDIAPISSIPSTIKASTIADPIFGFDPKTGQETKAFQANNIDMMTIDNLPNELPRDASEAFGNQFMTSILEELLDEAKSPVIARGVVCEKGDLGEYFEYLRDYVDFVES